MGKKVCKPVKSLLQQQADVLSDMRKAVDATVKDRARIKAELDRVFEEFQEVRTRLEATQRALDDTDGFLKAQREKLLREAAAAHTYIEVGVAPDREAILRSDNPPAEMVF